MKRVRLGPQIISLVVTRFFWPPLMPRTMLLPTCHPQLSVELWPAVVSPANPDAGRPV